MKIKLTKQEKDAIAALKKVASTWPDTLWLFGGNGGLAVMRKDKDGRHAMNVYGGVDTEYMVDNVEIEAEGGGW